MKMDLDKNSVKAIKRSFTQLENKFAKKAVRKGLRNGTKQFKNAIDVPKETGALKKALKVRASKRSSVYISYNAIFSADLSYIGRFLEFGTKNDDGSQRIEPMSFVRDAFNKEKENVARATVNSITEETNRIIKEGQ